MKTAPLIIVLLIGLGILGYIFLNKQDTNTDISTQDDFSFFEEENNTKTPPINPTPINPPVTPPTNQTSNNTQVNTNTQTPSMTPPVLPPSDSGGGATTTTVMVPLIVNGGGGQFGPFGCNSYLDFIPMQVPQTSAVLAATYNWLFSGPSSYNNYINVIASQYNLNFQNVNILNGIAKIYLTGSVMGNHCADATFAAQIEQAALQYPTVNNIEVYLNGQLFNWCSISDADPSEDGCDTTQKLWNSQRIFEIQ